MNNEEFNGSYALVNPGLTNDPINRQGQVGIITFTDTAKDDVYVSFDKGQQGLYSSDALLVFKKSNEIYHDAFLNVKQLDTADFKQLVEISLLLQSGSRQDARTAMEMAAANPVLRQNAMHDLKGQLGIVNNQAEAQQHTVGIGR